jgi:hypothetical protein
MISNFDYKDIRDASASELSVLYNYYTATYGHISSGYFLTMFKRWCIINGGAVEKVTPIIVNYLDIKHEYTGFTKNWR